MSNSTQFVCPGCGGQIPATRATRVAIIQSGCPRCTAEVSRRHFDSPPRTRIYW